MTNSSSLNESQVSSSMGASSSHSSGAPANPVAAAPEEWEEGEERSDSLLYLNNNISIQTHNELTPYHKKSAFVLTNNVSRFCSLYGIENCAFLTLTFPDNVEDPKEASRRFNSLNTNFLKSFYGNWMWIRERQKRGAWHYHMIVECKGDVRAGFDWDVYSKWIDSFSAAGKTKRLRTGNPFLRSLWSLNRRALPQYGFGRSEILPVRSGVEAVSKYLGKYIAKQIGQRPEEDKGTRLTGHSSGFISSSPKLSFLSEGSRLWREKVQLFAWTFGCTDFFDLSEKLGKGWGYRYRREIFEIKDVLGSLPVPF